MDDEPDKTSARSQTPRRHKKRQGYVTICPEVLTEMKDRMRELRRGSINLLRDRDDVPDGLTPGIIDRWFNRDHPGARADHLHYFQQILRDAEPQPDQRTVARRRNTLAGRLRMYETERAK